ncbi:MAG: hypothetical protein KC646_04675 [Candidatus Cloacimonetes bacterium]|nr:hypothetical protein [Candidatus Cloacimonadota bacterium]
MKLILSLLTLIFGFTLMGCVQTMEDNSIPVVKSKFLMGPKGKKLKYDLGIKTSPDNFAPLIATKTRVPTGMSFQMQANDQKVLPLIDIAYKTSKESKEIIDIAKVQIKAVNPADKLSKLKINLTVIEGWIRLDAKSVDKDISLTLNVVKEY